MSNSQVTSEQKARDILERMEIEGAQSFTSGELVEIAELISGYRQTAISLSELIEFGGHCSATSGYSIKEEFPECFEKAELALSTAKRIGII